jgi:hypothetical protein
MESFMNDLADNSWTTVTRNKKTAVPTGSGGYIPPHLRAKAVETPKPSGVDVNNAEDFPTLGGTKVKTTNAWGSKTTFTQKIHELIAFEQRTEAEKMEAEEAAKELEGYAVLNLKFDRERYIAFNERMSALDLDLDRRGAAYDRIMYAHVMPKMDEHTRDEIEEESDYEED